MEFRFFFNILMCSSGGGGGPAHFFSTCEKLFNFWNFGIIKVANLSYTIWVFIPNYIFLIGKSEKSEIEIEIEY